MLLDIFYRLNKKQWIAVEGDKTKMFIKGFCFCIFCIDNYHAAADLICLIQALF